MKMMMSQPVLIIFPAETHSSSCIIDRASASRQGERWLNLSREPYDEKTENTKLKKKKS